jgi:hypothetical protein
MAMADALGGFAVWTSAMLEFLAVCGMVLAVLRLHLAPVLAATRTVQDRRLPSLRDSGLTFSNDVYKRRKRWRMVPAATPGAPEGTVRSWILLGFACYLFGTVLREEVVIDWGALAWPRAAFVLSDFARVVKIAAALMFIGGVTYPRCGHRAWLVMVALSLAYAVMRIA